MNCQRQGENLRAQIRVVLCALKREQMNLKRLTIAELKELNTDLHREAREAGLLRSVQS